MNPTASIVPLFVFCGTVLADLPPVFEIPSINSIQPVNLTSDGVLMQDLLFYLHTNKNPIVPQRLFYKNQTILSQSFFNSSQPLKLIVHGWKNNETSAVGVLIRQGFLAHGNFNVITVDWSIIAEQNYIYAANRVRAVGALLGEMIDFLVHQGSDPSNITVVGHSLGAHVAGLAALQANANISHVIGLDPAAPGFSLQGTDGRISTKDAKYVEIVHTCGGILGIVRPLGHADFYPNGGGPKQPGCGVDPTGSCAHSRSYEYYAESLNNPDAWFAVMCKTWEAFEAGQCKGNDIQPFPSWKVDYHKPPGIYQLRTASTSPYGLGINGTKPGLNATLATQTSSALVNAASAGSTVLNNIAAATNKKPNAAKSILNI